MKNHSFKTLLLPFLASLIVSITSFAGNTANEKTNCIKLFNGKNLKGWHAFSSQKSKPDTALFHVEKGIIKAYGKYQGYIISEQSFKNKFIITAEFRWNTDSTALRINNKRNSGVMYNVPVENPDELWPKGIQFQIKDKATGDFILLKEATIKVNGQITEPGKSVTAKRIKDAEKPVGEWNKLEIVFDNGHCLQYLNGELVNEGFEASVTEGRVMLLFEGFPIDFKNVCIQTPVNP
jgi:hypothetical protein